MFIRIISNYLFIISLIFIALNSQSCDNESIDQNYADNDNDGYSDLIDNCPFDSNQDQIDSNFDGIGDICSDIDDDGIIDAEDNCPSNFNPLQADNDGDIGDTYDIIDFTCYHVSMDLRKLSM